MRELNLVEVESVSGGNAHSNAPGQLNLFNDLIGSIGDMVGLAGLFGGGNDFGGYTMDMGSIDVYILNDDGSREYQSYGVDGTFSQFFDADGDGSIDNYIITHPNATSEVGLSDGTVLYGPGSATDVIYNNFLSNVFR